MRNHSPGMAASCCWCSSCDRQRCERSCPRIQRECRSHRHSSNLLRRPVAPARRLAPYVFLLVLIGVPVVEVFVFIEVGQAIGWLLAVVLLLGTSVVGLRLVRVQGRSAIERVSRAVSERRAPAGAAVDGALGFLGSVLLVVPGLVTDVLGALLIVRPTRTLTRRWLTRRYEGRMMSVVATAGRFASSYRGARPADVESTAVEDDADQLGG